MEGKPSLNGMKAMYSIVPHNFGPVLPSRLFIDNMGTYLVKEEPGKLKFQTAAGWPMTLRRNVAPQAAQMQHQ